MEKKDYITRLASKLTSGVEGFKPDGPFLVRVAVLVCDSSHCLCRNSTDSWCPTENGLYNGQ